MMLNLLKDFEFQKRLAEICKKYKWFHLAYGWYLHGYVSEKEIRKGVQYLEKKNENK